MNIHHLELFYHVAKNRGITAASRKMPYGIQQPAISGQLGQLEKTVGTQLFHRRPFGLTPAGARLFAEIEPFFAGLDELPHQLRGQGSQCLRLAAPATILRQYLPKIFVQYQHRFRGFRLTLYDANQASAEELLRKREIDIAITELEGKPASPIKVRTLLRLPLALVFPKRAKFRTLSDLFEAGAPINSLISLPPGEMISKQFQAGLTKLGLSWAPVIEVSSLELIDTYASLGFGTGLSVSVPSVRDKHGIGKLQLRNFAPLTIGALWIGDLAEPAASFLADIQKLAGKLGR